MGTKGSKQTTNWFLCFWMKQERDARGETVVGAKRLARRLLQFILVLPVCLMLVWSGSSLLQAGQAAGIFSSDGQANTDAPRLGQPVGKGLFPCHAKNAVLQYKKRTSEAEADREDADRDKQGGNSTSQKAGEKSGWTAMKPAPEVNVDTVEVAGGYALYNFNSCTAVGISEANRDIRETETDYGFVLKVLDADSVSIHIYNNDAGVERFQSGLRSFQRESGLIDSFKRNTNLENCTQRAHQRHLKNFCGIIETSNLRGFSYVFPQERFPTNDSFRSCTFRTNCQRTEGFRTFLGKGLCRGCISEH